MTNEEIIISELSTLENRLEIADRMFEKLSRGYEIKLLVQRFSPTVRLKMDANKNHSRPHIHLDYGNEFHSVSISIDTIEVMAGDLPRKYSKEVMAWVLRNKEVLLKIWHSLQNSENPASHLLELRS